MEEKTASFLTTPVAILIGSVIISIAVLMAGGIIKIKGFSSTTGVQKNTQVNPSPAPQPTEDSGPTQVSLDDDPVLGDKNAPVTLIEFSDYECPFCKRHFDQVYPELKRDYIDSGKVKLVYRDFPLSFHDPMATTEAIAANCAREQGGDATYFKIHDEMFTKTTSNGNGLSKDKIVTIASDLGLNLANLKSCMDSEKYKDEVAKDIKDGTTAGVDATPTFIIGKSSDRGTIEGIKVIGAQPYQNFKIEIDKLL